MKGRLQAARSQTAGVVDRTNELQARAYVARIRTVICTGRSWSDVLVCRLCRQKLTIWAEAANAFVHKFQLTPEQLTALR